MEDATKVWVPSGKTWANILSEKKISGINLYNTDYVVKGNYGGLIEHRSKKHNTVDENGVPKWAEEPCPTFYTLQFTPFIGMCPIGCKGCLMQDVWENKAFREQKFAIFREEALRKIRLPKKPAVFYVQSSFEAFHWQYASWMHDLIFDTMVGGYWHYWFEHTRCPEVFVKRILAGKPLPEHNLLGVSIESDHDVRGFCKASSIDTRLRNIEILTNANVDLYVSIAPFIAPKNALQFASRLKESGVTRVALACDQLHNSDAATTFAARDLMHALGDNKIVVYVNTYTVKQWALDQKTSPLGPKFISWGDDERKLLFDVK